MRLVSVYVMAVVMQAATGQGLANQPEGESLNRDPFAITAPAAKLAATQKRLRTPVREVIRWRPDLTAIVLNGERSVVQIDGKILRVGELLGKFELVQVKRYKAIFARAGRLYTVELYEGGNP